MLEKSLKRFLTFLCSICFITNIIPGLAKNNILAASACIINVAGYKSIDGLIYDYETDDVESGTMSVSYKLGDNGQETTCTPNENGTITEIPTGSKITFILEPKSGFTPALKINNQLVQFAETGDNKYTGIIENLQAPQTDVEAVFTSEKSEPKENIVVNLRYIEEQQIKNGIYNDNFKVKWSNIEYSTDGGNTYVQLNQDTTVGDDGSYTFDSSIDSIILKLTWNEKVMAAVDGDLAENGKGLTLTKGSHTVVFQDAVYTLLWFYIGEGIDDSAITKHGKISIEKVDGIDGREDSTGGVYAVTPGTQVTMHFTPDYGYQFTKNTIDDELEVTPGTDECSYTFTMPEDHVLIGDIFTENSDEINISTESITSAGITNASDILSSGNAELTVADAIITEERKNQIISAASEKELTPIAYLDMELNKFLTKGATGENWETLMPSTNTTTKITLTLADELKSEDSYAIMVADGDKITWLDATYNQSEGTLQFETDKFSVQYVIAKKTPTTALSSVVSVITGDQNGLWIYSLVILAAAVGFMFTFKSSRKNKFKI